MEAFGDMKFSKKQRESDAYCWSCHRDEPELFCSTCVRSFHISPACSHAKKMTAEAMGMWRCAECIELENGRAQMEASEMDVTCLNKLLNYISGLLQADEYLAERFLRVKYGDTKGSVFHPLDLIEIGEKTKNAEYTCIEEFWSDIKWIVHNTKVHRSGHPLAVKATKWLLTFTKGEIYTIRLCHECYSNANQKRDNWFTKPCKKPHIPVWAKQKGFPFWPAKLMAVDNVKHTIDVQFFGDHKRIVLYPKDCYLYSKENPSAHFGAMKEMVDAAVEEAESYIQNIIMKFGTFRFAKPNTMLNEQMLDRHLYDMIPNAWKGPIVPPPIPEPTPGSATSGRRKTVASRRKTITSVPPKLAAPITGGTLTRRMSMSIAALCDNYTDFITFDQPSNQTEKIVHRIQPVSKVTTTFSASKFQNKPKAQSVNTSLETSAKKRKITDGSGPSKTEATPIVPGHSVGTPPLVDAAAKSSVQNNSSCAKTSVQEKELFKVPAPPRGKKSSVNVTPCTIIPLANLPTFPHRPINSVWSSELLVKEEQMSTAEQLESMDDFESPINDTDKQMAPKIEHSPEMVALCNAMIEKNTHNAAECIRSSLESTLIGFMDATNPAQQIEMLHEQLSKQQVDCDIMVANVRKQNVELSEQLEDLKGKHEILINKNNQLMKRNNEFIENMTNLKAENEKLIGDLKRELAKNANLNSNLNAISTKNATLASTVETLREISQDQAKNLKLAEAAKSYLAGANKALTETTEKLKTELENFKLENEIQRNQMNAEKKKAYDECAKMIADTKEKKWCATCGMPGGRFYCNDQCETYYWQLRSKNK